MTKKKIAMCSTRLKHYLFDSRRLDTAQQIYDIAFAFTILHRNKKMLFDPIEAYGAYGKSTGALIRAAKQVAQPDTVISFGSEHESEGSFPLLSKPQYGRQGRGIRHIEDRGELFGLLEEIKGWDYEDKIINYGLFLQPDLRVRHSDHQLDEFRVIVIGGKAIGAIKRSFKGHGQGYESANAEFTEAKLTDDLKYLAEKASVASNHSFSGLDILQLPNGDYTVLECNRNPQFRQFEGIFGEGYVAERILQHIRENYDKTPENYMKTLLDSEY